LFTNPGRPDTVFMTDLRKRGTLVWLSLHLRYQQSQEAELKQTVSIGRKLATSLRGGELTSIRVPSRKYRDLRHLVQLLKITTKQSRNYKCRIKALLLVEGIPYPNTTKYDHWANNTILKLETLDCGPEIRFKLDSLFRKS